MNVEVSPAVSLSYRHGMTYDICMCMWIHFQPQCLCNLTGRLGEKIQDGKNGKQCGNDVGTRGLAKRKSDRKVQVQTNCASHRLFSAPETARICRFPRYSLNSQSHMSLSQFSSHHESASPDAKENTITKSPMHASFSPAPWLYQSYVLQASLIGSSWSAFTSSAVKMHWPMATWGDASKASAKQTSKEATFMIAKELSIRF